MIITKLNEKFPDMPNLRVRDIRVDKLAQKVYCTVSYPDSSKLSPDVITAIKNTVAETIPKGYRCETKFANDKFTDSSFVDVLQDVLKKKFPLYSNLKSDKITAQIVGSDINAAFFVSEAVKRSMETSDFLEELNAFFKTYTCYDVSFSVNVDAEAVLRQADVDEQERLVQLAINKELLKPRRFFNVRDVQKYLGKEITAKPMYISDVRKPMDICVVCGKISDKELKGVKNNPNLQLCKFNLTDDSQTTIPCIMFARYQIEDEETLKQTTAKSESEIHTLAARHRAYNDKKKKQFMMLYNGLEVLARGKVVYSAYSQRLELQVYDINLCRIEPLALQPKFERAASEFYVLVHPEPMEEYRQMALISHSDNPSFLTGKDVVVIEANTTGYNVTKDKLYCICAIRIVDGRLREKFCSYVSPEISLPEEVLKKSKITLRKLSSCPTLTEIVADLFKFVADSTLVGVNLSQLLELLNYYGAPLGYCFKNKTANRAEIFSTLFDGSDADKPNCSDINDVMKALKIEGDTANAEEVATCVARCMSELARRAK